MPKVSIIIPTYNCARLICRTINSVQRQTFRDWELFVVDDGSTDNTKEVVTALQKEDPRIIYIYQNNSGAPASPKNNAIKLAQGDYIAFLDHDDEWLPAKLEKQISVFNENKVNKIGLVASGALIVAEESGDKKEYLIPQVSDHLLSLLERNFIFCSSGVMVKKEVFSEVGLFDDNFRFGDDWDMWVRIALRFNFHFIDQPLYIFYRHKDTMTSRTKNSIKIRDYERGLTKHFNIYKNYPVQYSNRLLAVGRICYIAGAKIKGLKFIFMSIKNNPLNWRSYINLFFAVLGSFIYKKFINLRKKHQ